MTTPIKPTIIDRIRVELKGDQLSSSIKVAPDAQDIFLWLSGEPKNVIKEGTFTARLHVVPDYITYGKSNPNQERTLLIGKEFYREDLTLEYIKANLQLSSCSNKLKDLYSMLSLLSATERRKRPVAVIQADTAVTKHETEKFFVTNNELIFPIRFTFAVEPINRVG